MSTQSNYSEKDISTNLLVTLKHMKAEFNVFTQEASNPQLYDLIYDVYLQISNLQRDVFQMMSNQGWYPLSNDTAANISKAYTKFETTRQKL